MVEAPFSSSSHSNGRLCAWRCGPRRPTCSSRWMRMIPVSRTQDGRVGKDAGSHTVCVWGDGSRALDRFRFQDCPSWLPPVHSSAFLALSPLQIHFALIPSPCYSIQLPLLTLFCPSPGSPGLLSDFPLAEGQEQISTLTANPAPAL